MAWVYLDDEFHSNPKIVQAGLDAAGLYARALSYCGAYLTDGFVPGGWANEAAGRKHALPQKMVELGLWNTVTGGFQIRDYLEFNPAREVILAKRAATSATRAEAGRKGASSRWQNHGKPDDNAMANEWQTNDNGDGDPIANEWPHAPTPLEPKTLSASSDIQRIYDYWREKRGKTRGNYAQMSEKRRKQISARLREFSVDELCAAIDGVGKDPWPDRVLQDDITIIFRNHEQVEKFLDFAEKPRGKRTPEDAAVQAEAWVKSVGWQYPDADLWEELGRFGLEGEQKRALVEKAQALQETQV